MNIRINGLHLEVTSAINDYVLKRFSTFDKFLEKNILCEIELSKDTEHHYKGDIFKAEGNIASKNIFAVSQKSDLYEAIDDLKEEMERILTSRKDKSMTLFRKGALKIKNIIKNLKFYE
jgi:putative sigma-54 modulation protein